MTPVRKRIKSRSERKEELRARIISESLRLFLDQGYDQTTMRQILQKTGILNGSLYNVFKGKDEIYSAVLEEALFEALDEAQNILGEECDDIMKINFPFILEMYAASKSKKIASLISVGFQRPLVREKIVNYVYDGLMSFKGISSVMSEDMIRFKSEIAVGALGSVISLYERGDVTIRLDEVVDSFTRSMIVLFDYDADDIDLTNSKLLDIISKNDIEICGIKI